MSKGVIILRKCGYFMCDKVLPRRVERADCEVMYCTKKCRALAERVNQREFTSSPATSKGKGRTLAVSRVRLALRLLGAACEGCPALMGVSAWQSAMVSTEHLLELLEISKNSILAGGCGAGGNLRTAKDSQPVLGGGLIASPSADSSQEKSHRRERR